jgi:cytochrome c biogenesis protein CcmG/thiol:disulfide interchange protein DsbE
VYGVPETFVIDGDGKVAYRYPGPLSAQILAEKIMPAIRKAERGTGGRS